MKGSLFFIGLLCFSLTTIPSAQAEWKRLGSLDRPVFSRLKLQCSQRLSIEGLKVGIATTSANRDHAVESSGDPSERSYFLTLGEVFVANSSTPSATALVLYSAGIIPSNLPETEGQLLGYHMTVQIGAKGTNEINITADFRDAANSSGVVSVSSPPSAKALRKVVLEQSC